MHCSSGNLCKCSIESSACIPGAMEVKIELLELWYFPYYLHILNALTSIFDFFLRGSLPCSIDRIHKLTFYLPCVNGYKLC